jgi:hypothetical protein
LVRPLLARRRDALELGRMPPACGGRTHT